MARSLVALITDFGTRDHYVGAVKGAILAACPDATLVDVAHDLPPHDVWAGAFALAASYRAFPAGTVFMAVVDPGVGSARRALAVDAGGYRFVGPDNGILGLVLGEQPEARVHEITNAGLFRYEVSATFHARDIFGPVAGHLARGASLDEVGPRAEEPARLDVPSVRKISAHEWLCTVLHVDHFGNLITTLTRADLDGVLALVQGDTASVLVVVEGTVLPLIGSYAEVSAGEACAILGSSGRLEVSVNQGNACEALAAVRGTAVRVRAVPAEP